jgi:hypothetical protein
MRTSDTVTAGAHRRRSAPADQTRASLRGYCGAALGFLGPCRVAPPGIGRQWSAGRPDLDLRQGDCLWPGREGGGRQCASEGQTRVGGDCGGSAVRHPEIAESAVRVEVGLRTSCERLKNGRRELHEKDARADE